MNQVSPKPIMAKPKWQQGTTKSSNISPVELNYKKAYNKRSKRSACRSFPLLML